MKARKLDTTTYQSKRGTVYWFGEYTNTPIVAADQWGLTIHDSWGHPIRIAYSTSYRGHKPTGRHVDMKATVYTVHSSRWVRIEAVTLHEHLRVAPVGARDLTPLEASLLDLDPLLFRR